MPLSSLSEPETFGVSLSIHVGFLAHPETLRDFLLMWGTLLVECHLRAGLLGPALLDTVSFLLSPVFNTYKYLSPIPSAEFYSGDPQPAPVLPQHLEQWLFWCLHFLALHAQVKN